MTDEQLRKLFKKLDKTNTGFINAEDYRKTLQGYSTPEMIRDTILEMDGDLDGKISFQEFKEHMQKSMVPEPEFSFSTLEKIDWFDVFVHYDKDGSGKLSAAELKTMLEEMGRDIQREEVIELFRALDRDFDGVISYAEFSKYYGKPSKGGSIDIKV